MIRMGWTTAAAIGMLGTVVSGAGAQTTTNTTTVPPVTAAAPAPPATVQDTSMKSTQLGVYTDDQAKRGQQVYAGSCASCHTPSSHQGSTFTQNWDQHPLFDLFSYVSTQMPQDNPGSLAPSDAADVVAFLLKVYSMPAGTTELAPDTVAMKKILIDSRTTRPPQ
ncbi:MAG: c-type cytochrome [Gemmatimonadales bacterium]